MNYPNGTTVQNYNVSAGRVILLPCFADQSQPSDGFRAVVFATPTIASGVLVNQVGPTFNSGPCAIQFDMTQLIQNAALSRARSIMVATNLGKYTGEGFQMYLMLDSGMQVPIAPVNGPQTGTNTALASDACICVDFLAQNPIFGLYASNGIDNLPQFTVAVANFKLMPQGFSSGVLYSGV